MPSLDPFKTSLLTTLATLFTAISSCVLNTGCLEPFGQGGFYTPPQPAGLRVEVSRSLFGGKAKLITGSEHSLHAEGIGFDKANGDFRADKIDYETNPVGAIDAQGALIPALIQAYAQMGTSQSMYSAQVAQNISAIINAVGDQPAKAVGLINALYGGRSQLSFANQGLPQNAGQPFPGTMEELVKLSAAIAANQKLDEEQAALLKAIQDQIAELAAGPAEDSDTSEDAPEPQPAQ